MRAALVVLVCALGLAAEEPTPGRAAPAAPPPPQALVFRWENYRSIAAIGDGVGTLRPTWVATYEISPHEALGATPIRVIIGLFGYHPDAPPPPKLVVAYRAQAFLDAAGDLHIDARQAVIAGPQADAWSPDSFVIRSDGSLGTEDDNGNGNAGTLERRLHPPDDGYRRLLTDAQVAVGGGI